MQIECNNKNIILFCRPCTCLSPGRRKRKFSAAVRIIEILVNLKVFPFRPRHLQFLLGLVAVGVICFTLLGGGSGSHQMRFLHRDRSITDTAGQHFEQQRLDGVQKSGVKRVQKAKRQVPFHKIIDKAAKKHELDPALIRAVIMAESSFNPRAVSRSGARGLMQLMPKTARSLGVVDSLDPELNIEGGAKYLRRLLTRFNNNTRLALAAYNAGSRNVRKYNGIPPFKETRNYVKKVMHLYWTDKLSSDTY